MDTRRTLPRRTRPIITPLKRALFDARLTQTAVAAELAMDVGNFNRIVNGLHPAEATKERIANTLRKHGVQVDVDTLWPHEQDAAA